MEKTIIFKATEDNEMFEEVTTFTKYAIKKPIKINFQMEKEAFEKLRSLSTYFKCGVDEAIEILLTDENIEEVLRDHLCR